MPLTELQQTILALLAQTRSPDSYLAGGAALHFTPNSVRYSNDLEFFHDSPQRVASAFSDDAALLEGAGYGLDEGDIARRTWRSSTSGRPAGCSLGWRTRKSEVVRWPTRLHSLQEIQKANRLP